MSPGTDDAAGREDSKAMPDRSPAAQAMSSSAQQERLSLALSSAAMGTWDWDVPRGTMEWDRQMLALFGLSPGDFAGSYQSFLSLIHAEDRERTAAEINTALDQRMDFDGEFRVAWPSDGSTHFLRMRFKAPQPSRDATTRVVGVCWDVTDRRLTEQQLAKQGNLLNMLMVALPDHIYFKDRESRFIAVNKAKAARSGLDPKAMTGKTDFDYFSEEHARAAFEDEQRVIATGEPIVGVEEKETWPDGGVTWVSTTKLPLRDEKGEIIGTFGLSRDITQRKRMEEELRAKNEALEQDLEMARELQTALLPQHYPCFPHGASAAESAVHFHHYYRPSTTVSGDFFDTLEIDDNKAGLFICDVMGHGVRAALVAAIVRTLVGELRAFWSEPTEFLSQLNGALRSALRHTHIPLFASAFYVVADLARSQLRYANAGHPCPLHIARHAGDVPARPTPLNGGKPGAALGLFDDTRYENHQQALSPHDVILLFTDGLFEVEGSKGELFDYQRLTATVTRHSALAPANLCQEVVQEIQRFSAESEFTDDVCLVAMEI